MSNATTAALALALGAGAGIALHYLTRDDETPDEPKPRERAPASTASPASATTATPPRKAGACSLKLDKETLTLEGEKVDVPTAVTRCKAAGRAELAVALDAPAWISQELVGALVAAGVPVATKTP
jgi:hypothetical protein